MLRLKPFAALRPPPALAARVACVPYDVINAAEARGIAQRDALSFIHVSRAEVDLPADVDPHDASVYSQARHTLGKLRREGALVQDRERSLFVYQQSATLDGRQVSQSGIVGCCHIDDYAEGLIKKHEKTRQDKEDDRTQHTLAIRANAGPVFMLYERQEALSELVTQAQSGVPLYDFDAGDGVRHCVWRIADADPIVRAFAEVSCAYIADGHHRSAAAARAGRELREQNPAHTGDEEYNWFLCVLFAHDQLNVLPYHRLVKDLNGLRPAELLEKLAAVGTVTTTDQAQPERSGCFGMYLQGQWYRIELPEASVDKSDPIASLDYVLLYDRVLAPLLGIGEIRTDPRIDFVGGIRGTGELERRVSSGEMAVAFAMHATTLEQLMRVSDAGAIMPPKSTWFEPKLRSGLLIHTLD
jgi:uncharacterized protein (DUF1015 family)